MIIPTQSDGNCFFRCVAAFLHKDIQNSNRNDNGHINNKKLRDKETNFAKFLRYSCVNVIEAEKHKYDDAIYYDDELYESIDDHIDNMYKNNVFSSKLEMKIISKMFKINFNVYVLNDNTYNLINSIGSKLYRSCNLLLCDNHYSLITHDVDENNNNRPDTPRFVKETPETDENSLLLKKNSPIRPSPLYFNNESPPPIPLAPKPFILPVIKSPSMSTIYEDISPEIKSYVDTQVSLVKMELMDMINSESKTNVASQVKKIINQIENSNNISKKLEELIENLNGIKNN